MFFSISKEIVIALLLLFYRVMTFVTSAPTALIPKSMSLFSAFYNSNFRGQPSPVIENSISCSPLMSNLIVSEYFFISLGVKIIGISKIF